jgi:hypothetical protein
MPMLALIGAYASDEIGARNTGASLSKCLENKSMQVHGTCLGVSISHTADDHEAVDKCRLSYHHFDDPLPRLVNALMRCERVLC